MNGELYVFITVSYRKTIKDIYNGIFVKKMYLVVVGYFSVYFLANKKIFAKILC